MDSDQGKIFVGGITWETNDDTLRDYFGKYGEVAEVVIMKDRLTLRPRGFGFVLFSDPSVVDEALQDKHTINGRLVEVKRAIPRGEQQQNQQQSPYQQNNRGYNKNSSNGGSNSNSFRTKKIFVGGLSANLTEAEFKGYFEKFGKITDVVVMYDSHTQRPRGFGFITFDTEEAVEAVMQKNFHELNDKKVEVKRAVPKDGNGNGNGNNNMYNMRTGVGRGSYIGGYPRGLYPPFSYPPIPFSGYPYGPNAYGGYPVGYGGVGFGAPLPSPRSPWNGLGMAGPRRSPLPYGNAPFYPTYSNGFMGTASRYQVPMGSGSEVQTPPTTKADEGASFRPFQPASLVGNSC